MLTGYAAINEPTCGYTSPMSTCNAWGNGIAYNQPYNTEIGPSAPVVVLSTITELRCLSSLSFDNWLE